MSTTGSVTMWLGQLKQGDESALAKLHERYWPVLVARARKKLTAVPALTTSDEDIAQEAFWSFFRSLREGRVPRLASRDHFLAFLSHVIACKAVNLINSQINTEKRPKHRVADSSGILDLLKSRTATPAEEALLHDCYAHYVEKLPDGLRDYAEMYLAGIPYKEIAKQKGVVERTVERKVALLSKKWQEMAADSLHEPVQLSDLGKPS